MSNCTPSCGPIGLSTALPTVVASQPGPDYDHTILCDPGGTRVVVVVSYNSTGVPSIIGYTMAGAIYVGSLDALVSCGGGGGPVTVLESDPIDWCLAGNDVTQWIVKSNGQPNGDIYWTDTSGAVIAPPVGATKGKCDVVFSTPGILGFSGAVVAAGYPNIVESITISITAGEVNINGVVVPMGSRTWGQGTSELVDTVPFVFTGVSAASVFDIIWEV